VTHRIHQPRGPIAGVLVLVVALALSSCSSASVGDGSGVAASPPTSATSAPASSEGSAPVSPAPPAPPAAQLLPDYTPAPIEATALVAGDLALCASQESAAVGRMVEASQGLFITTGDQAYPSGSQHDFEVCYDTYFGHAKQRTLPVPGNHEYETEGAAGYYAYFGRPKYYTEAFSGWRFYFLDSNCDVVEGCTPGTGQYDWLEAQLEDGAGPCVAFVWHHPRWSSNEHGDNAMVAPLVRLGLDHGVDMILSGHDHGYERFGRLDAAGGPAEAGVRQFVVGTGGAGFYEFGEPKPGSRVREQAHGLLALDLADDGYAWRFIDTEGRIVDRGRDSC
jgi:3',5'-cyclic AMP phosphodiesterase CpdA